MRREGREAAIQYLYQHDLNRDGAREAYYKLRGVSPSARRFCDTLLDGVAAHLAEIDDLIAGHADNYEFERISAVDRAVLRLAVHEILHCPDIPAVVSINEAIEIAKKYSGENSGAFVNGILDNIRTVMQQP